MSAPGTPVDYSLFCNAKKGHSGLHTHTFPPTAIAPQARPVATQLQRIEQGLDKLMQSHAALDGRLANIENHGASMGDVRDMRVELRDMLTGLDGRLKGLGNGLADALREARGVQEPD